MLPIGRGSNFFSSWTKVVAKIRFRVSVNPSLTNLVKISAAFQVSLEELLSRPRSDCALILSEHVPMQEKNRGQSRFYKLLPDKIRGLEIDRIEIEVGGTMSGHPHGS